MCEELGEQMTGEKWSLKDKLFQLKGVVDLHERNKQWAKTMKKEIEEERHDEIEDMQEGERTLREAVHMYQSGDLEGIGMMLRQDPNIELQCKGKPIDEVENIVRQAIFLRRKELDRLIFESQQKEDSYLKSQYKLELMKIPPKLDAAKPVYTLRAEEIEAKIENLRTKQEAAQVVKDSYDKIKKFLKRDSRCYDTMLAGLHEDGVMQCQCIIRSLEMGQMAIEDEAGLKERLGEVGRAYRLAVHHGQEGIEACRRRVVKARNVHTGAHRPEQSHLKMNYPSRTMIFESRRLMDESEKLKKTMLKMRDITQTVGNHEIYPRIEKMMTKKYRLVRQMEINQSWLETELQRQAMMQAMSQNLLHSIDEDAMKYKINKQWYLDEIKKNKAGIASALESILQDAKILIYVQNELIKLYRIVEPVKIGAFQMEALDENISVMGRRVARVGDDGARGSQNSALDFLKPALKVDLDAPSSELEGRQLMDICQLLDVISAKVDIIKTQIGYEQHLVSEKDVKKALALYKEYMMSRAAAHLADLPKPQVVEEDTMEMGRSKLPTREEMKANSKRIVAAFLERPHGPATTQVKKHSCF